MPEQLKSLQERVADWMLECFTPEIAADTLERNDRFIEESLELVQSLNYSADRAHALVDYVFGRDIGEPAQEVGGVMITLAALCGPNKLDMIAAGEVEYNRINQPAIIEKIRAKQALKPTGSALPIPTDETRPAPDTDAVEAALRKLKSYVGVCRGDKELTERIIPELEAVLSPKERAADADYSEEALAECRIDFLEARADEWMADTDVQKMFNAIASVFEKYAPQETMDRFREQLGVIARQCHVEGAVRTWGEIAERMRSAGTPLPTEISNLSNLSTQAQSSCTKKSYNCPDDAVNMNEETSGCTQTLETSGCAEDQLNAPEPEITDEQWDQLKAGGPKPPGPLTPATEDGFAPAAAISQPSAMTEEWCMKMAKLEGGCEIGAGLPDHPLRTGGRMMDNQQGRSDSDAKHVTEAKMEAMAIRTDEGCYIRVIAREGYAAWSSVDDEMNDLTAENSEGMLYHIRSLFVPHGEVNPLTDLITKAIDARSDKTGTDLAEGDSAVAESDLPEQPSATALAGEA